MDKTIQIRIKSFLYSLSTFAVLGVLGFLASPDFANLVTENFGNTAMTSIILLVVPEIVKAIRNAFKLNEFGARKEDITLI